MTKKKSRPLGLHQPADRPRMTAAIDWLLAEGLPVRRCTIHQLRVGPINFWPERGTINLDGGRRLPGKGLRDFKAAVAQWQAEEEVAYR